MNYENSICNCIRGDSVVFLILPNFKTNTFSVMENQNNIVSGQRKPKDEFSQMDSDLENQDVVQDKKDQKESKYDSHSEQLPHQDTIVNVDGKQDRSSSENRENYPAANLDKKEK